MALHCCILISIAHVSALEIGMMHLPGSDLFLLKSIYLVIYWWLLIKQIARKFLLGRQICSFHY